MGDKWNLEDALANGGSHLEVWQDDMFIYSAIRLDERYSDEYSDSRDLKTFFATGDPTSTVHQFEYKR